MTVFLTSAILLFLVIISILIALPSILADILFLILILFTTVASISQLILILLGQRSSDISKLNSLRKYFFTTFSILTMLAFAISGGGFISNGFSGDVVQAFGDFVVGGNSFQGLLNSSTQSVFIFTFLYGFIRSINNPSTIHSLSNIHAINSKPKEALYLGPKIFLILTMIYSIVAIIGNLSNQGMALNQAIQMVSVFYCGSLSLLSIFSVYYLAEFISHVLTMRSESFPAIVSYTDFIKYTTCRIAFILALIYLLLAVIPGLPMMSSLIQGVLYLIVFILSSIASKKMSLNKKWPTIHLIIASLVIALLNIGFIAIFYIAIAVHLSRYRLKTVGV
jgi:hypothetical protein